MNFQSKKYMNLGIIITYFFTLFPISNFSMAKDKFYVVYTENNRKFIKTFFQKLKQAHSLYYLYQKFINVDIVVRTITHII